ncbi:MAG: efflux RND transporter periplasmic adaptor subunit [Desulfovibrio sp.]|jgi:membrane fusion protein (multidrug efflux system)|nr:efflux RND transporter periplasmic adaptor subunit [Desulfovibrio sp.]
MQRENNPAPPGQSLSENLSRPRSALLTLSALTLALLCCACEEAPRAAAPIPLVRYSVIKEERLVLTTELPGRVSALITSDVRPQVSGIIRKRLFEEGSDVTAGQTLYEIEPAVFEAACKNAEAALAMAEANEFSARLLAERYGKIIKRDAVSRQEYDNAISAYTRSRAEVEAARKALEAARINLGYTKVTAPVSGRISRSYITQGALATQNQIEPLATIQSLDRVYVDISQANTEIMRLRGILAEDGWRGIEADKARIRLKLEDGSLYGRLDAAGGDASPEIFGVLLFSDITIDKSTGMVNIRAEFENQDKLLLPGMHVRAIFEEAVLENSVLAPQKTVQRDQFSTAYVYVLENGDIPRNSPENTFRTVRRDVRIQRNIGNTWLITSGLKSGDRLLVEGHLKTGPGKLVTGAELPSGEKAQSRTSGRDPGKTASKV